MTADDIEKLTDDVQEAVVADNSGDEEEGGDDDGVVVVDTDAPKKKKSKILCIILYIDISFATRYIILPLYLFCNTSHLCILYYIPRLPYPLQKRRRKRRRRNLQLMV